MSAIPKPTYTPEEYLVVERDSEIRHEFYRGELFAMAGATAAHNQIALNVASGLMAELRGKPCRVFALDMRVKVRPNGLYTYPDVAVACPPIEFEDDTRDTLLNPKVIVEVLSKTTEKYDRGKKFDLYRELASLQQYVLIAQSEARVASYVRQADGVAWLMVPGDGPEGTLDFPT
ncbi:MAG TPA: Uma2 family endonuclease, partial [Planctomycetaceae bacterium]|nr:Uma2 family endonuclease [Planctomycetaceae bacterium]